MGAYSSNLSPGERDIADNIECWLEDPELVKYADVFVGNADGLGDTVSSGQSKAGV